MISLQTKFNLQCFNNDTCGCADDGDIRGVPVNDAGEIAANVCSVAVNAGNAAAGIGNVATGGGTSVGDRDGSGKMCSLRPALLPLQTTSSVIQVACGQHHTGESVFHRRVRLPQASPATQSSPATQASPAAQVSPATLTSPL